jgi:hypothetical protein
LRKVTHWHSTNETWQNSNSYQLDWISVVYQLKMCVVFHQPRLFSDWDFEIRSAILFRSGFQIIIQQFPTYSTPVIIWCAHSSLALIFSAYRFQVNKLKFQKLNFFTLENLSEMFSTTCSPWTVSSPYKIHHEINLRGTVFDYLEAGDNPQLLPRFWFCNIIELFVVNLKSSPKLIVSTKLGHKIHGKLHLIHFKVWNLSPPVERSQQVES